MHMLERGDKREIEREREREGGRKIKRERERGGRGGSLIVRHGVTSSSTQRMVFEID